MSCDSFAIILLDRANARRPDQICRGFFLDPRHLGNHFTYLTGSPPLDQNTRENLKTFIGIFSFFVNVLHGVQFRSFGNLFDGRRFFC